jgi:3-methyladenine DNA glycosylase AlkD
MTQENWLSNEIVSYCKANSNDAIVKKYAIYFKEGIVEYDAYGVSTNLLKALIVQLSKNESLTIELLLSTAPILLKTRKYEETIVVLLLAEKKLKGLTVANFKDITQWFEYGIVNWAHCDTLCNKILPWFFLRNLVPLSELTKWQTADPKFQRRAVPVLLIKLLKATNDYSVFFNLIAPLMMDSERVVHQGLGWFLREAWKKQPEQTEEFLMLWKDVSPRLIIQYATEKMSKEDRLRFKKLK